MILDFSQRVPAVLVVVIRNHKGRVTYNSGRRYFYDEEVTKQFIKDVKEQLKFYHPEICTINIKGATTPTDEERIEQLPGEYWCPYCKCYETFKDLGDGYKHCPICGMSDNDFYVKIMNHLKEKVTKPKKKKGEVKK